MSPESCTCRGEDGATAKKAIRAGARTDRLVEESHFSVSIVACGRCGQLFLTLFCERVDWADSDDPQEWIAAPISAAEALQLRQSNVADDENAIRRILASPRRYLHHDMPKGAPETLAWKHAVVYIPAHD